MWEEGPSGELVIEQKLLVLKESHVVSRVRLGERTRALGRGSSSTAQEPREQPCVSLSLSHPTLRGS